MVRKPKKIAPNYNQGDDLGPIRQKLNDIIFGAETPMGKLFDVVLIISILLSVTAIMLDSVPGIQLKYGAELFYIEWFFTILFSMEYLTRLFCVRHPILYARSFFGIVDLISIIPTYLSLFIPGAQYMLVIRVLRVLRLFRILKLAEYMGEANILMGALDKSRRKIMVFLYTVLTLVVIFGAMMYMVEGGGNGFTSIPKSVYWAIVTLTTVGYGDIVPQSPIGQALSSAVMIMGYGIIAVPTGIYSAELVKAYRDQDDVNNEACPTCGKTGHDNDADFCKYCGHSLNED